MPANLSVSLQYDGQYDPAVAAELQQLLATIQQWANGVSGAGIWKDIDPATLKFVSDVGTWAPDSSQVLHFSYCLTGTKLDLRFYIIGGVTTGAPNIIYVKIPLPFRAVNIKGTKSGYLHGTTLAASVNQCLIRQDLDVYADGIAAIDSSVAPLTLRCCTRAAGAISPFADVGIIGQISCEVTPLT